MEPKQSAASLRWIMASKRSKKYLLLAVVLLYMVVSCYRSHMAYASQFRVQIPRLPTTSHTEGINLRKFQQYEAARGNGKKDQQQDLRQQLSLAFPYEPEKPIPRRVWQTWKVGANSNDFPPEFRKYSSEWIKNDFEYSLLPDEYILPFLLNLYGEVPIIVEAFRLMPKSILKADFLRYLLLYARGGIYSDMDTVPLKKLSSWPSTDQQKLAALASATKPIDYKNYGKFTGSLLQHEPGFVIGIEADPDRPDWSDWYARRIQFCQWTIQSKPGHPILRELILNITATTLASVTNEYDRYLASKWAADYNVNNRHSRLHDTNYKHIEKKTSQNVDGSDIMNWTGPGIFSDIVFEYLNNIIKTNSDIILINGNLNGEPKENEDESSTTKKFKTKILGSLQNDDTIPWEFFSLITEPVLVDDVMVLPITGFSPDVGQMGAQSSDNEMALVKHMFSGTWKKDADENAGHNK